MDGRIEVGDQIVQVNRNSFENLSDIEAVDLLRKAAASRRWVIPNLFPEFFYRNHCGTDILFTLTISGQLHFMLLKEYVTIQINEQIYSQRLLQKRCLSIYHFG